MITAQNMRLLIVDDDQGVLDAYRNILAPSPLSDIGAEGAALFGLPVPVAGTPEDPGYELCLCDRGKEAVEAVHCGLQTSRPFSVAFLDISMPGMDGVETARRIWAMDPKVKIVVVTAYSRYRPDEITQATQRADLFFIRKPFHPDEIKQFARALTRQWSLENERDHLSEQLARASLSLGDMNRNLQSRVEEQARLLVQSEKMASIGVLASGVAHEINNPISFVDSNLATLRKYAVRIVDLLNRLEGLEAAFRRGSTQETAAAVEEIGDFKKSKKIGHVAGDMVTLIDESLEGTSRVKKIVADLKTFSRMSHDELGYADINEILDSVVKLTRTEVGGKAQIVLDYGHTLPRVMCNAQKIGQVFLNLLINAAQAIQCEGAIDISTRCRPSGNGDRQIEVSIRDNGQGISQEEMCKIFDPFYTTKPVGQGTGLGLSIAYDIVSAHGGSIQVNSSQGAGTTFTILLPVAGSRRTEKQCEPQG